MVEVATIFSLQVTNILSRLEGLNVSIGGMHYKVCDHFDNDRARTTNNVEGWHSKVNNKLCQHGHPNIFVTVKILQKIQATNEVKITQLEYVGKARPKKIKYANLEVRRSQLKQ